MGGRGEERTQRGEKEKEREKEKCSEAVRDRKKDCIESKTKQHLKFAKRHTSLLSVALDDFN